MIWSRRLLAALSALVVVAALAGAPGSAAASEFEEFGIESAQAEETTSEAGRHPDVSLEFVLNHHENSAIFPGAQVSSGRAKDVSVALPPGLIGEATRFPECATGQFEALGSCPTDSQVGIVKVWLSEKSESEIVTEPLYNLEPTQPDQVARLGFIGLLYPIFVDVRVRTASDYGITAEVHDASGLAPLISARTVLWGVPADPSHNTERITPFESLVCGNSLCLAPGGERASGLVPEPFVDNPSACEQQSVGFKATSYQLPGQEFSASASLPPITGCENLSFDSTLQMEPTSRKAGAPTGLSARLRIPQNAAINLPAAPALRAASVTLPEGMTLAAGAADGLEGCSAEQVGLGQETESGCPLSARLGTATFVSPALPKPLKGWIYQRSPEPGHLFRIWLVTDELGLHLKIPGEVVADKQTGQLTAEFSDLPQLPVEEIDLEFRDGARAPLQNPAACGTYETGYQFTPWSSNAPLTGVAQMKIDEGCDVGGFSPHIQAGVSRPVAGAYSPLIMNLVRPDGDANLGSFAVELPQGLLAKLKGVAVCPDAAASTGACPEESKIGSVAVATGTGPQPLWIPQPGKQPTAVYLAGPYKGAPNSIVTKVPAQAGPFDLGTVVVRAALDVNPDTARATVSTDPLPQILEGVPVLYRTIHADIDRPDFAIAPTNCREMQVDSTLVSVQGTVAHPTDRFQVGDCGALGFHPRLSLKLQRGKHHRRAYPALTATLKTGRNEANVRKVSVALPHVELLAQEHIDTICTRVQFNADNCPKGSIYGYAKAVTPLLAKPLQGPVYLRSSNHQLPDLVAALHGQFDINLVGRIDSINEGIRTTFTSVPDAPVTKFVLKMKGGKKGLLVNSEDLCGSKYRAVVKMDGQNGKAHDTHPLLQAGCGG